MKHLRTLSFFLFFSAHVGWGITPLQSGSSLLSGGIGITANPGLLLVCPQFEMVHTANFLYGGMLQAGLGYQGIFTMTGTARVRFGNHPKITPSLEGGLGIVGGSGTTSGMGFHIMFGMGADYEIDPDFSVGTMIRVNFAPPLRDFFLSWPLIIARIKI